MRIPDDEGVTDPRLRPPSALVSVLVGMLLVTQGVLELTGTMGSGRGFRSPDRWWFEIAFGLLAICVPFVSRRQKPDIKSVVPFRRSDAKKQGLGTTPLWQVLVGSSATVGFGVYQLMAGTRWPDRPGFKSSWDHWWAIGWIVFGVGFLVAAFVARRR